MPQKIYFDESGFTGNNLLHPRQNYFAYASIASDDDESKDLVEFLIKKYNIQNGELKGANLVKFAKGRKAITEILAAFDGRIKISISDKKFALAGKIHEYIFEPCYSDVNSLFYGIGFHRFIANTLYTEFVARGAGAEELFEEFESLMRKLDGKDLQTIFSSSDAAHSDTLRMIREFAQKRHADIQKELDSLAGGETGKWVLDLTDSALFTLLANWGTQYEQLTAICDHSKPLLANQEMYNGMIGNTKKIFSRLVNEQEHPVTFNLSGPIEFADSRTTHGIQLADTIAAAAVYVFSGKLDASTEHWRDIVARQAHYGSVIPDMNEVKLENSRSRLNALVLHQLHDRATRGVDLIEGAKEMIMGLARSLSSPQYQMKCP